jgi:hypothetical protein
MKDQKIFKEFYIKTIYPSEFDGTLDEIISFLEDLKHSYLEYKDLHILETGDCDSCSFSLYGSRLETDKEFEDRLKMAAKITESQEKAKAKLKTEELQVLEKLAKKYKKKLS